MRNRSMLKIVAVAGACMFLGVLAGCAGLEYAPKRTVLYYHKELPAADGRTMVLSGAARVQEELAAAREERPGRAILAAEGKRFVVAAAGAVVGRSRECDVVLGDSNVSRRHARLFLSAGGSWAVEDLGSTNGVHVNGQKITGAHELQPGDRLDIGTVSSRFEVE